MPPPAGRGAGPRPSSAGRSGRARRPASGSTRFAPSSRRCSRASGSTWRRRCPTPRASSWHGSASAARSTSNTATTMSSVLGRMSPGTRRRARGGRTPVRRQHGATNGIATGAPPARIAALLTGAACAGPRAGAGPEPLPHVRLLLWSLAEGGRGRRWRASTRDADGRPWTTSCSRSRTAAARAARNHDGRRTDDAPSRSGRARGPRQRRHAGGHVLHRAAPHLAAGWRSHGRRSPTRSSRAGPTQTGQRVVASIDADLVPTLATVAVERLDDGRRRVGGRESN